MPNVALFAVASVALALGAALPVRARLARQSPLVVDEQRVVPVTRRRLRQRGGDVGWPTLVQPAGADLPAEERGKMLRGVIADADAARRVAILIRAVHEEEGELRLTALKALASQRSTEARDMLRDVMRSGSDAERSLAIDGLSGLGAIEDLREALNDRLEPLAAKAALALCPSRRRDDLVAALGSQVEPARRDAILALLAGFFDG